MGRLSLPDELLGLPFPWNQTSDSIRQEYLEFIGTDKATTVTVLLVMERSLKVASWFPRLDIERISEQTKEDWFNCIDDLARAIPELELHDLAKIEQVLELNQAKSITTSKLEQIEHLFLWWIIYHRGYDAISWCQKTMKNCPDPELVDRYLSIASGYELESDEWFDSRHQPFETAYNQRPISDMLFKPLAAATPIIAGDKGIPLLAEWSRKEEELKAAQHARSLKWLSIEP